MDFARTRLETERTAFKERLAALTSDFDAIATAARDSNADDEHDPEGATIAFERSQIATLVQQTRHHLDEIEAALERLDAGTYGVCETCRGMIGEARLEARPIARTCISCAS